MRIIFYFLTACVVGSCSNKIGDEPLPSPDGRITVSVWLNASGQARYALLYQGKTLLDSSELGLKTTTADFTKDLKLVGQSPVEQVNEAYETVNAKRRHNRYRATRKTYRFRNAEGQGFDVVFQVSDDGVAFRYHFPYVEGDGIQVLDERTSFHFPPQAKGWLQPVAVAKSGWEQTNPSYEEHYEQGIPVGTPEPTGAGWVYPALFQIDSTWVLITEAGLDGRYCATRLRPESPEGEYRVGFPDDREVISENGLLPLSDVPFYSPWRVIAVGSLATIVESTLGLDVAESAIDIDKSAVKPGKSSWSWINSKDDYITYDEQRKYIDFAADMNWQYCLVDVNWDRKIGYDKIKELADYAGDKGVGLLLWYNSAGDWNTVKYSPKNKLLTPESRTVEFRRIKDMGIKGVKIDFFGGDGRSVIQYYIDILNDAAKHGLLVNFHGATLPRGWSRTYPHLMTVEAVRGFEMVTFGQEDADKQATLSTILPFTRNAFDPMDFTPMNLNKVYTPVQRRTTPAFELATSVLFLSGIQHYAESPEGMSTVPRSVKDLLRTLPDSWDDVRFVSGYPGRDVVIARQAGSRWYVAGINGEAAVKQIAVDLQAFKGMKKAMLYTDDVAGEGFRQMEIPIASTPIELKPNGGFLMVLE